MDLLRFTTAGSVDDGKSTLIGRLLYDSKAIFQDQLESLERSSELAGSETIDLAYLTDGLRAEREQGITIDVAYRYFSTPNRKFIIADTPGHEQYTRNMVTGASTADLALLLVDAKKGISTQSKRHALISSLLGIKHAAVVINKMDLVDYSEEVYQRLLEEYKEFAKKLDIHDIEFFPISALVGDNVVEHSPEMKWYEGPTVLQYLENVTISADRNLVDFRFPVQYVVRDEGGFRGYAGRIAAGTVKPGQELMALPSKVTSTVQGVVTFDGTLPEAGAGDSVVLRLNDEIDVSRGDMLVRPNNVPVVCREFEALLTWMDDEAPIELGSKYYLRHTSQTTTCEITELLYAIDVNTLHREETEQIALNEIGRVRIKTDQPLMLDAYHINRKTGSFIIIDPSTYNTVGAGMVREYRHAGGIYQKESEGAGTADHAETAAGQTKTNQQKPDSRYLGWEIGEVTREDREARNKQKAHILWFTGLSGAGKSTIAKELEKRLFKEGRQVIRLDGDNVRHGLCSDLGFSEVDRRENIRRIAHTAELFFQAGFIVLCSFISPYRKDRDYARSLVPEGRFSEVYVKCTLEECIRRDPKGLYEKAMTGQIKEFTGISSPYEEPANPEIVVDTNSMTIDDVVNKIIEQLNK